MAIHTPIAMTIAGSDSGGGAGIQADLKTFSALNCYGTNVITAITAQNTCTVTDVHEVPAAMVSAQIDAVLSDIRVNAIKIGMLFSVDIIKSVAEQLARVDIPIVLDPVMIAKSGDSLLQKDAISTMINDLFKSCDLLTPNLPEAAKILGCGEAKNLEEMTMQAFRILTLGPKAVLLKGGHGQGDICHDILVSNGHVILQLDAKRQTTKNTHGTGCTYSAAIAANLSKQMPLKEAVKTAHAYLQNAIKAADGLNIGHGHGPVHHFYDMWSEHD